MKHGSKRMNGEVTAPDSTRIRFPWHLCERGLSMPPVQADALLGPKRLISGDVLNRGLFDEGPEPFAQILHAGLF